MPTKLAAFNQCLNWLTQATTLPKQVDGLVLCGNSQPATATAAGQLAQQYALPRTIIAGGIGHATKYLRQNLGVSNTLSEATMMADLVRQTGYQGEIRLDQTSTNSGSNAVNALALAPSDWRSVLLAQDPVLARRTALTFVKNWGTTYQFSRYQPQTLSVRQLDPLVFTTDNDFNWPADYLTELVLGECQRLIDTPAGYGPLGTNFIPHVDVPEPVIAANQFLQQQALRRKR
ncbi:ElyC/SanA/YdcF family protein [Lactiplantibacillus paraxiangfangensis]|uniref:ElyC/SanA/YdcF family protein n=1 Tax=Lactiplantibacillus paraxiangfangensis TaxID=3076224 RepID=UPI0030C67D26